MSLSEGRPEGIRVHADALCGCLSYFLQMVGRMESLYKGDETAPVLSPDEPGDSPTDAPA